ncbi:hypothetical protein AYI70_g4321 [Smittium culicis]|uniref:Uncharacterized protein n=1 Tax=Smittium culicis TaxID=133412 RepID=A0A1R1XZX8_9FUNG|nr:hypothetical protein AYI70_g4321 [Smittium culicis]
MTKSSLKFSHPEPAKVEFSTPSASLIKSDAPKTNFSNAIIHGTPKTSGDDKYLLKNESPGTKSTTINRLRGTVGLKKPPDYSINLKKLASDKNQKVSPDDDTESDESKGEARLGKISEKEFMDYVSKVDCAPQGRNLAGMDLDSDPPDQSSSDIEI